MCPSLSTNAVFLSTVMWDGRETARGKSLIENLEHQVLRGLPIRAPCFHNGMAASLEEVVDFYDTRFTLNLNKPQKSDLVAFLKTP